MTLPETFYAGHRARVGAAAIHEGRDTPPEKLLQAVWQHQRLNRDSLHTFDGRSVRILHPGFKNREAGPDFRDAVIRIDGESPSSGDIEIDLNVNGWHAHGHDRNRNFEKVILHVVWDVADGRTKTTFPSIAIRHALDAPIAELNLWMGSEAAETWPEGLRGRCCAPLRELPAGRIEELLHQAARVRLQSKAAWLQACARQSGWEQALWLGLFRALGYKQNVWPMQRLGELRERLGGGKKLTPLEWQSRLLGIAGLLPAELTRAQGSTDTYLRRIWDLWWRERDAFIGEILPSSIWKFSSLRPANHPQRRLALAAHWLARGDLADRLKSWCIAKPSANLPGSLLEILQSDDDEFWSWHWTLKSTRMLKPQPLLGTTRVTDLAINVILPWLWARAGEGRNDSLRLETERRYSAWPAAEDNSLLKLARQRLLGGAGRTALRTAAAQQGLLQIVRDFCEHSNAVCDQCGFPDLVRVAAKVGPA